MRERVSEFLFLTRRVGRSIKRNRVFGLSAEIAYFEILTIFPFLVLCVSLIGLFPSDDIVRAGLEVLNKVAPDRMIVQMREWIESIQKSSGVTLLSVGGLGALWIGSMGIGAFINAFAVLTNRPEKMKFWRRYLIRVLFTGLGAIMVLIIIAFWLVGPPLIEALSIQYGIQSVWKKVWIFLRYPLAFSFIISGFMCFYHTLAYSGRPFRAHLPGAIVATALCWGASYASSLYIRAFPAFDKTFGSLGGVTLLMLWFFVVNLSILIGEIWNLELHVWKKIHGEDAEDLDKWML